MNSTLPSIDSLTIYALDIALQSILNQCTTCYLKSPDLTPEFLHYMHSMAPSFSLNNFTASILITLTKLPTLWPLLGSNKILNTDSFIQVLTFNCTHLLLIAKSIELSDDPKLLQEIIDNIEFLKRNSHTDWIYSLKEEIGALYQSIEECNLLAKACVEHHNLFLKSNHCTNQNIGMDCYGKVVLICKTVKNYKPRKKSNSKSLKRKCTRSVYVTSNNEIHEDQKENAKSDILKESTFDSAISTHLQDLQMPINEVMAAELNGPCVESGLDGNVNTGSIIINEEDSFQNDFNYTDSFTFQISPPYQYE